jgi:hypothetical protein
MDLGLERELLELAAPDLEMFLRTAGGYSAARAAPRSMGAQVSARTSRPELSSFIWPLFTHESLQQ